MGIFKKLFGEKTVGSQKFAALVTGESGIAEGSPRSTKGISGGPTVVVGPSGLRPQDVLMLSYAETFKTSGNSFQQFWKYRYGIDNPDDLLHELEKRGLIRAGDLNQAIENGKVSELKQACSLLGIKASGKKNELVERLRTADDPNELLQSAFPDRYYVPTESGSTALRAEPYIRYIHNHQIDGLDIWNIGSVVAESDSPLWRDAIWGHLNKMGILYSSHGDFGLYRNIRFEMASFLAEENRYAEALQVLFEVEYLDINGCANGFNEHIAKILIDDLAPYSTSPSKSAPGIIATIFKYAAKANISETDLRKEIASSKLEGAAPLHFFTLEECADIVFYERDNNTKQLEEIYSKAQKRLLG